MKICIKDILDIVEYGYFSKPIVNYLYPKINDVALKYYLLLLKSKWERDYYSAIDYANKVISVATTTVLRELARFEIISLYNKIGKSDLSKKEFIILRNNFDKLSSYARNIILPGLKHLVSIYEDNYEYMNLWSKNYEETYVEKSILKYSDARKKGNYNKAYELFIEGYNLAKKFPHPTMTCNGLNVQHGG